MDLNNLPSYIEKIHSIIFSQYIWTIRLKRSIILCFESCSSIEAIFTQLNHSKCTDQADSCFRISKRVFQHAFDFYLSSYSAIDLILWSFKGFCSFTSHCSSQNTRLLRTVGEFYHPLCVILLLGFIFSLNGCPFFCCFVHMWMHVPRECLTRIDRCEKVMFTASGANKKRKRKPSNWQFNSSKFKIVSSLVCFDGVLSALLLSLCVNNRPFWKRCCCCLFASEMHEIQRSCLKYVIRKNLLWKVFPSFFPRSFIETFNECESVELEVLHQQKSLCTVSHLIRLIYRITRFLFGHNIYSKSFFKFQMKLSFGCFSFWKIV